MRKVVDYIEDFGGNTPEDPQIKPEGIPQVMGLSYELAISSLNNNSYKITKKSNDPDNSIQSDHTYPNDDTMGYFLDTHLNMSASVQVPLYGFMQQYVYLSGHLPFYLSFWVAGIAKNGDVRVGVLIDDANGNRIAAVNFPLDTDGLWKNCETTFNAPSDGNGIRYTIVFFGIPFGNTDVKAAFDDISIYHYELETRMINYRNIFMCFTNT
jgi:hypothetical protein